MPSWRDLRKFCERDGWDLYKDTDLYYYRRDDETGNVRRVKVSKGTGEIGYHLWREILSKQIQVTMEYFNSKI